MKKHKQKISVIKADENSILCCFCSTELSSKENETQRGAEERINFQWLDMSCFKYRLGYLCLCGVVSQLHLASQNYYLLENEITQIDVYCSADLYFCWRS